MNRKNCIHHKAEAEKRQSLFATSRVNTMTNQNVKIAICIKEMVGDV